MKYMNWTIDQLFDLEKTNNKCVFKNEYFFEVA